MTFRHSGCVCCTGCAFARPRRFGVEGQAFESSRHAVQAILFSISIYASHGSASRPVAFTLGIKHGNAHHCTYCAMGGMDARCSSLVGLHQPLARRFGNQKRHSLVYPSKNRFHLLPPHLRLTTGSVAQDAVLAFSSLIVLSLLLPRLPYA